MSSISRPKLSSALLNLKTHGFSLFLASGPPIHALCLLKFLSIGPLVYLSSGLLELLSDFLSSPGLDLSSSGLVLSSLASTSHPLASPLIAPGLDLSSSGLASYRPWPRPLILWPRLLSSLASTSHPLASSYRPWPRPLILRIIVLWPSDL
jgi:hypothetical protein